MTSTATTFHWPWHEVYTARRYPLTDPKRTRVSTTTGSLLNFALSSGQDQAGPSLERGGSNARGPLAIYHNRTAIALYYLAIDEAQRAITSSPPRPSSAHSHHSGSDLEEQQRETAYQQGLRLEYPNLFASSLLQDMLYLSAPERTYVLDIYCRGSSTPAGQTKRASQDLDDPDVLYQNSTSIKTHIERFPYSSSNRRLSSRTTVLSLLRPAASHAHEQTKHYNPHPSSHITRTVLSYPLLLLDEAYSLAHYLLSTETQGPTHRIRQLLLPRRDKQAMLRDKQEILRFFNLSLIIKLREIEQTKFDFSDSSFRAYGKVMSDPTRKMVRETIGVFENFNEELAVIVSKEEATWERWEKTTSEDDWWSISVGDLAKKRWMEWKEIIRLLGILLEAPASSSSVHHPVSRLDLED